MDIYICTRNRRDSKLVSIRLDESSCKIFRYLRYASLHSRTSNKSSKNFVISFRHLTTRPLRVTRRSLKRSNIFFFHYRRVNFVSLFSSSFLFLPFHSSYLRVSFRVIFKNDFKNLSDLSEIIFLTIFSSYI